jgi:hypothetical protein
MAKKKVDISELTTIDPETGEEVLGTSVATNIWNILMRIVAVFAASGLSVIGAGALVGIDTVKAMILAGTLGVATVVEKLARGFLDDGKLTAAEINSAFASVDKKKAE